MGNINNTKKENTGEDMDKDIIDSAVGKKYTEFAASVKQELHDKLNAHPEVHAYAKEYDKIQAMKQAFADITNSQDEE